MIAPLLLENVRFAVDLFTALVFFAVAWLYIDAFSAKRKVSAAPKIIGFLLLAISFLLRGTIIETTFLTSPTLLATLQENISVYAHLVGYLFLIVGLLVDPIQKHPKMPGLTKETFTAAVLLPGLTVSSLSFVSPLGLLPISFPILAIFATLLYLRRATVGLERHLRVVALAFGIFSLSELLSLATLLRSSANVTIHNLVAPFSVIWFIEHGLLLLSMVLLGRWVWHYLLRRLQTQLFMIFITTVIVIFLIVTVSFTVVLIQNVQTEALARTTTDVKVLRFVLDSRRAQILADAQLIAQNDQLKGLLQEGNLGALADVTQNFFLSKQQNFLVITNAAGQVVARGEDRERIGDSLSDDPLIRRTLLGQSVSTLVTGAGVLAPEISITAVAPIFGDDQAVIGVVKTGVVIDNAFVDGIKAATGLESALYGDAILSATTLVGPDGASRSIGARETNVDITEQVLDRGEEFSGSVEIFNTPYFAAYTPLFDVDGAPIGMLFVGRPQVSILQTAGRSIEQTFLIAIVLIALSIIPAYFIGRYIEYQVR